MNYNDLLQLYFDRSNALQWYWTLYVVIVGGILAFSSLRLRGDLLTTALITILFACFAYKNLGAIGDTTHQRFAALKALKEAPVDSPTATARLIIEPTLTPDNWQSVRNFHITSSALTIITIWALERRRRKTVANTPTPQIPPAA